MPAEGYIKLELGAGDQPSTGGFTLNDIVAYPQITLVGDCRNLSIETATVTIIRAIHLLEHFAPDQTEMVLHEWMRCLCPCGVLEVAVPDLQKLALMAVMQNISQEALLRDVYGLAQPPEVPAEQRWQAILRLSKGCQGIVGHSNWLEALVVLYEPLWWDDQPNTHKWGYDAETLEWTLRNAGLKRIVVEQQETALHAWGEKKA